MTLRSLLFNCLMTIYILGANKEEEEDDENYVSLYSVELDGRWTTLFALIPFSSFSSPFFSSYFSERGVLYHFQMLRRSGFFFGLRD